MNLGETASELLAGVVEKLEDKGREVPARRYVHASDTEGVAIDCQQLVLSFQGLYFATAPGQIAPQIVNCATIAIAQFELRLDKCVPVMNNKNEAPSATKLSEAGVRQILDAKAMQEAVFELAPPNDWEITAAQVVGPQGGFASISLLIGIPALEKVNA